MFRQLCHCSGDKEGIAHINVRWSDREDNWAHKLSPTLHPIAGGGIKKQKNNEEKMMQMNRKRHRKKNHGRSQNKQISFDFLCLFFRIS